MLPVFALADSLPAYVVFVLVAFVWVAFVWVAYVL